MSRLIIDLLGLEKGKAYGFQEYIFNLLNYFYAHRENVRYEKIVIWCKDSSKDMLNGFEDKFDIEVYSYSTYIRKQWIQTVLPIRSNITKKDLLFSPGNISGLIKRGTELLTIHDLLFKRKEWMPSKLMRLQREVLVPISIKKADKIVAISHFTKDDVEHFYPQAKGKIEVIYNSFNFSKYEGNETLPIGLNYFLAISTNANYKNQKTILEAYKQYYAKGGRLKIVFVSKMRVGTDAYFVYKCLPQSIKANVVWVSNISNEELGALYKGASCFISASMFEGLGMPVVEAMSFGLPVLLSDIPPHREISQEKGELFDPNDVKGLASKMLSMSFEKCSYGDDIRNLFSEENTSAKYVEVINELYSETH